MKKKWFETKCKKNAANEFIYFCSLNNWSIFATRKRNGTAIATTESDRKKSARTQNGAIAQLVEQWTENPCVPGSIPGGTTKGSKLLPFVFYPSKNLKFRFSPSNLVLFTAEFLNSSLNIGLSMLFHSSFVRFISLVSG